MLLQASVHTHTDLGDPTSIPADTPLRSQAALLLRSHPACAVGCVGSSACAPLCSHAAPLCSHARCLSSPFVARARHSLIRTLALFIRAVIRALVFCSSAHSHCSFVLSFARSSFAHIRTLALVIRAVIRVLLRRVVVRGFLLAFTLPTPSSTSPGASALTCWRGPRPCRPPRRRCWRRSPRRGRRRRRRSAC